MADQEPETKICPQCGDEKVLSEYGRDKNAKNGHHSWCRQCVNEQKRRRARAKDPVVRSAEARAQNLRRKYFLTTEQAEELWLSHNGQCAICKANLGPLRQGHAIDHCHESKRVRGLLCMKCNMMLGLSDENPGRLRAAADYLEMHVARTDLPIMPPRTRSAPLYESDGLALTAKEWASRSGISATTIHWRRKQGISLALPPQPTKPRLGTGRR